VIRNNLDRNGAQRLRKRRRSTACFMSGIRTRFGGTAVGRGNDRRPAARLSQNMGTALCPHPPSCQLFPLQWQPPEVLIIFLIHPSANSRKNQPTFHLSCNPSIQFAKLFRQVLLNRHRFPNYVWPTTRFSLLLHQFLPEL